MIVILLNGYPLSGKDTFIDIVKESYRCHQHSTIDACVDIAEMMGWDGVKNDESREMLSDLKKWMVTYFDAPFKDLIDHIDHFNREKKIDFFITVSREGKEINRTRYWCRDNNIKFVYIFLDRDTERDYGNSSDNNVLEGAIPNVYFNNKGDMDNFRVRAADILNDILSKDEPFV